MYHTYVHICIFVLSICVLYTYMYTYIHICEYDTYENGYLYTRTNTHMYEYMPISLHTYMRILICAHIATQCK